MVWFILTLAILLIWAIPAFRTLQRMGGQPEPPWRIPFAHLIDEPEEAAVVFFLLGIVFAIGGYTILHGWGKLSDVINDFYANIAMECFGVAITVLIIERLYERRSKIVAEKEEKERLILQMGSPDNAFAIEAVRQLRKRGWLMDGSIIGANLEQANLNKANLNKADLCTADLSYANLQQADLSYADLSETELMGVELQKASLSHANLMFANLMVADLREASLLGVNFNKANLWRANLKESDLAYANLNDADLSYADLRGANLLEVDLTGANLQEAMLNGTFLLQANISGANLDLAQYDSNTQWPDGFDPKVAGAIEVELNDGLQEWIPVDEG